MFLSLRIKITFCDCYQKFTNKIKILQCNVNVNNNEVKGSVGESSEVVVFSLVW